MKDCYLKIAESDKKDKDCKTEKKICTQGEDCELKKKKKKTKMEMKKMMLLKKQNIKMCSDEEEVEK